MTRKKCFISVAVVALIASASFFVWASESPISNPGGGCGFMQGFLGRGNPAVKEFAFDRLYAMMTLKKQLKLTGEQRDDLRAILMDHKEEIRPVVDDCIAKKRSLEQAVLAENPDENAIRLAADEMAQTLGDAAVLVSKLVVESRSVLTPEQQGLLQNFRSERHASVDRLLIELRKTVDME